MMNCRNVWLVMQVLVSLCNKATSEQVSGECVCGISGGPSPCRRSGRVAGGVEVTKGELPWMVLLVIRRPGKSTKRCGGTLVNDRYLVLNNMNNQLLF